jgi:hypothetical protein
MKVVDGSKKFEKPAAAGAARPVGRPVSGTAGKPAAHQRIGAGGTKPADGEKWFYPGRWLVQGTVFAVAALTVRAIWNAVMSSDGADDDDEGSPPARQEGSDAA